MKNFSVCNDQWLAGWPTGRMSMCDKNLKIAIFLDTVNMINVKLGMVVVLTELYPFIPLSVTLIVYQSYSSVKQFYLKILCSYLIKLKRCTIVDYVK